VRFKHLCARVDQDDLIGQLMDSDRKSGTGAECTGSAHNRNFHGFVLLIDYSDNNRKSKT
jgi:hypothetical protein